VGSISTEVPPTKTKVILLVSRLCNSRGYPPGPFIPLPKTKILERHYSVDELAKLRLRKIKTKDKSCTDTNLYHVLDESKLHYIVEQNESVVLMDGDKVVAVIIRNFFKGL
jgi:hypothetical protein